MELNSNLEIFRNLIEVNREYFKDANELINIIRNTQELDPKITLRIRTELDQIVRSDRQLLDLFEEIVRTYNDPALSESIANLNQELFKLQIRDIFERSKKLYNISGKNKDYVKRLIDVLSKKIENLNKIISLQMSELEIAPTESLPSGSILPSASAAISPQRPQEPIQEPIQEPAIPEMPAIPVIPGEPLIISPLNLNNFLNLRVPNAPSNITDPYQMMNNFNEIIGKISSPGLSLTGGAFTEIEKLEIKRKTMKLLDDFTDKYNIFNTELFLKIGTIMYDKDLFMETFQKKGLIDPTIIIKLFFIEMPTQILPELMRKNIIDEKTFVRDKLFYSIYFPKTEADTFVIFIYKLVRNIYKKSQENLDNLFENDLITNFMISFFQYANANLKQIYDFYPALRSQWMNINEDYLKLINKNKKIYSFLKIRQDSIFPNPRFNVQKFEDQFLAMKYYNVGGAFGMQGNIYDRNLAYEQIISNRDTLPEYYYFGAYDGIFSKSQSNREIAQLGRTRAFINKILNYESLCVIGFGTSGSGKTSSLVYFEKDKQDGIIVEICKNVDLLNKFKRIILQIKSIFIFYDASIKHVSMVDKQHYNMTDVELEPNKLAYTFIQDPLLGWIYEMDRDLPSQERRTLGQMINVGIKNRKIEPTPNNPDSSRNHVLINITLLDENAKPANIVVCDLAGIENTFKCNDPSEIKQFEINYEESLKYKNQKIKLEDEVVKQKAFRDKNVELIAEYEKNINLDRNLENAVNRYQEAPSFNLDKNCLSRMELAFQHKMSEDRLNDQIRSTLRQIYILHIATIFSSFKEGAGPGTNNQNLIHELNNPANRKKFNIRKEFSKEDDEVNQLLIFATGSEQARLDFLRHFPPEIKDRINKTKNTFKERLQLLVCDYARIRKIKYNCHLRNIEGFMINRSLFDLQDDIKNLVITSIKRGNLMPLVYVNPSLPFCYNTTSDYDNFEQFYYEKPQTNFKSIIGDVLKSFKIDINSINFVLFAVINLTDNGIINNPPKIPYIKINNIKYFTFIYNKPDKMDKLQTNLLSLGQRMNKFPYYLNNYKNLVLENPIKRLMSGIANIDDSRIIIEEIDNLNKNSLLGSLESSEKIKNLFNDMFICSAPALNNDQLNSFRDQGINLGAETIIELQRLLDQQ